MTQSVYIAGNIVYVAGTVNGVSYTWTLTGDHVWSANAATSMDGVYEIALTAIDAAGNETSVTTTTYYGLHLKTNWTDRDFYNASDLNRVGGAVLYLADRLRENGYAVDVSPRTDWTSSCYPTAESMAEYLVQVQKIKDAFFAEGNLPGSLEKMTSEAANEIERLLRETEILINRMLSALVARCGVCHTGGLL